MARCVLLGGAPIQNYTKIRRYIYPDDFIIACDCGLSHCASLNISPHLIVGDFDSHPRPDTDTPVITLPHEKDDTDLFYAAKEGIKRGFFDFLLLGAAGARLDHTLGNVSVLLWLDGQNARALMVDDFSEMQVVGKSPVSVPDRYPYFSLLPVFGSAQGVFIKNAKYPLENAAFLSFDSYGVSNEVIPPKEAVIRVEFGKLLLIKITKE